MNSYQATQFRIWATGVLKEFIIKGFVLDDERLKQGKHFGQDYFDDLLERIREIRTLERRYYQKITDVYAECSADYDPKSEITQQFFKMVQNMMHWAVTHQTAAEIIYNRADRHLITTMAEWKQQLERFMDMYDYNSSFIVQRSSRSSTNSTWNFKNGKNPSLLTHHALSPVFIGVLASEG